jgi:hypothetical protein
MANELKPALLAKLALQVVVWVNFAWNSDF